MYEYSHIDGFGFGMAVFWLLIFVAMVWIVSGLLSKKQIGTPGASEESPLEILKRRYALGEIDDEEYQQRKNRLEER